MIATGSDTTVLEAVATLTRSVQASTEWRELADAQRAAKTDKRFASMVARQSELAAIQNHGRDTGQALDGKLLVELIALRERVQHHELYARQQAAWSAAVALLQRINQKISRELGFDFATHAVPRRSGCCG